MTGVEPTKQLLRGFSVEITPGDEALIDCAISVLPKGTETFIASLPKGRLEKVVHVATRLARGGLVPVPHLAARNIASEHELEDFVARLSAEAGVKRCLVIGGDRDQPLGPYDNSLQILKSGLLQKNNISDIYLSCYPEGHPRISDQILIETREEKLSAAREAGITVTLVSQFCFESAPIVRMVQDLRRLGIRNPVRVGLAGPTGAAVLLKYAVICGVGPSIRALRERQNLAKNMIAGNTEGLLRQLARSAATDSLLGICGVHFFTFGSLTRTTELVKSLFPQNSVTDFGLDLSAAAR